MESIWVPRSTVESPMGRINYFDVQFDNTKAGGVYHGGQPLHGTLLIDVAESVSVRALYILLVGESHTFWVNKTSDKIYESHEQYFNARIDLPYLNQCSDGELLPNGTHALPFNYALPSGLPSSFEGDYGYTRYTATARIELFSPSCFMGSSAVSEFQVDKPFMVSPFISSQSRAANMQPVRCLDSVDMVGCLGRRGAVEIELMLSKPEFRIGEMLVAQVTMNNLSRSAIKNVEFMLLQHTKFQAISRYESVLDNKEMNRVVDLTALGNLGAGKSQTWPIQMPIPQIPPSQIGRIIGIAYWAKLICKDNIEITLPVTILSQFG